MEISQEVAVAANALAKSQNAAIILYNGPIDDKGLGLTYRAVVRPEESRDPESAILFMTTYGGDAGVAYQIARLLQSVYGTFYLCVPLQCKSAGTLIALGAAGIYMPPVSELGPLDVQLRKRDEIGGRRRSGMVVRTALEGLAEETFKVFERAMLGNTIGSSFTVSFDVASRIATSIAQV
ncbi:MAG: hypothetical protein OXN84_19165 [Albidovulum sp.]|nr:hypothetical protein [Albidovulum sp.]